MHKFRYNNMHKIHVAPLITLPRFAGAKIQNRDIRWPILYMYNAAITGIGLGTWAALRPLDTICAKNRW